MQAQKGDTSSVGQIEAVGDDQKEEKQQACSQEGQKIETDDLSV